MDAPPKEEEKEEKKKEEEAPALSGSTLQTLQACQYLDRTFTGYVRTEDVKRLVHLAGMQVSFLGDTKSSLGDAKSSLGDAKELAE